ETGWWVPNAPYDLTNGASIKFGGPNGGGYVLGDTLRLWWLSDAGNGTLTFASSTDNSVFTTQKTIDTSLGGGGGRLVCTNVTVAFASYNVRVTHTAASGTKNRVTIIGAEILNSTNKALKLYDLHAGGQDLTGFVAMGQGNVATLLTNINPSMIVYEQIKEIT